MPQSVAAGTTAAITTTPIAVDGGLAGVNAFIVVALNRFDATESGFGTYQLLLDSAPVGQPFVQSGAGVDTLAFNQLLVIPAGAGHTIGIQCTASNNVGDQETIGEGQIDVLVFT